MGRATDYTTADAFNDFFFWQDGGIAAQAFYARQPPPQPGRLPEDYDFTPHSEAQLRIMRHRPVDAIAGIIMLEAMIACAEDGGDIPVQGLRALQAYLGQGVLKQRVTRFGRTEALALIARDPRRQIATGS